MPKKIKLKKTGKGFYPQMVNPLEKAHGDVTKLSRSMKNPPKAIRKYWPPELGGRG